MKVIILPRSSLDSSKDDLKIIQLRHPRTDSASLFLHSSETEQLQELIQFKEPNRSWFIGQETEQDGGLILGTPCDPLFLILPYLLQQSKNNFCLLEDVLHDEDYPHSKHLLPCCSHKSILNIAIHKDIDGRFVYKYSPEKTLQWLQKKSEIVAKVLEEKQIDVSDGSRLSTFVDASLENDPNSYLRYACHLVGEYITDELCQEMLTALGLSQVSESPSKSKREKSPRKNASPKKKRKLEEPLEDYSSFGKKLQEESKAKNVKLSLAQKQLQKVSKKGMKNISSFFGNAKK